MIFTKHNWAGMQEVITFFTHLSALSPFCIRFCLRMRSETRAWRGHISKRNYFTKEIFLLVRHYIYFYFECLSFYNCTILTFTFLLLRHYLIFTLFITKTRLFKYIENFISKNWKKFQIKKLRYFHISAQNIDCGYSLEPPRRGGSSEYPQSMFWSEIRKIMYTPVNPSFTI